MELGTKKPAAYDEHEGHEVLRKIKKVHNKKEILLLELSVYHNLIVTASYQSEIYVYNYEYTKVCGHITLDTKAEITSLGFLNGFQVLLVGANDGSVYAILFDLKDSVCNFEVRGLMNFNTDVDVTASDFGTIANPFGVNMENVRGSKKKFPKQSTKHSDS